MARPPAHIGSSIVGPPISTTLGYYRSCLLSRGQPVDQAVHRGIALPTRRGHKLVAGWPEPKVADEIVAAIDAVTPDDVVRVIDRVLATDERTLAAVGAIDEDALLGS